MLWSNERKLALSGWLNENHRSSYSSSLKLQKFLFFYECFSKVDGEEHDFSNLKGYKNGPVFSRVYGDYTKDRSEFNHEVVRAYHEQQHAVSEVRAAQCAFLVGTLSESELSSLTHEFNIWSAKKERILSGEYQVSLDESDFGTEDAGIVRQLQSAFPYDMIKNSSIIAVDGKYFVLSNDDAEKLTPTHEDTISALALNAELHNPIYLELDEDGRLLVD
ncbi:hypothetical protein [Acutalibacter sp.]|uniref:hypothetical protein n=1 Tax=Acutalibacter sp. TaxID=1918636 RepID=UPI0021714944|nr:hypothetical protein [Acutalibacter sp.]